MTPIEKRKAELREYIEARSVIKKSSIDRYICGCYNCKAANESARIAEQLLECIEALERIAELPKGEEITELDGWYAKRKAESLFNKIAGAEGDTTKGRIEK